MNKILTILGVFLVVMFVAAVATTLPDFFTVVRGATGSILLSADGGEHWFSIETTEGETDISNIPVRTIRFHPTEHDWLYLGTAGSGFFRSFDGGMSWQRALDHTGFIGERSHIYDIAFGPLVVNEEIGIEETYFVVTFRGGLGSILKTTDGGSTFREVYSAAQMDEVVTFLTIDPTNPNTLWAGTTEGLIVQSADFGETWRKVHEFRDTPIALVRTARFELVTALFSEGIARSTDNGQTWTEETRQPTS
jgi:photosystem II stability/assembly factor-like uncharacterized protein